VREVIDSIAPPPDVTVLFALALICGVVAVLSLGWAKASPAGWARLAPGLILLGAGALGGVLLSSAVMSLIALLLRDDEAAEFRREARKYSREQSAGFRHP
jgi:hypothetical protein